MNTVRTQTLHYLKELFHYHRALFAGILVVSVLAAALEGLGLNIIIPLLEAGGGVRVPFPMNAVVELFAELSYPSRIRAVALSLVGVTLIKNSFLYLDQVLSQRLQLVVMQYFRLLGLRQLMEVDLGYLNRERVGHLQTIMVMHIYNIGVIAFSLGTAVGKLSTAIFLLAMLLLVLENDINCAGDLFVRLGCPSAAFSGSEASRARSRPGGYETQSVGLGAFKRHEADSLL